MYCTAQISNDISINLFLTFNANKFFEPFVGISSKVLATLSNRNHIFIPPVVKIKLSTGIRYQYCICTLFDSRHPTFAKWTLFTRYEYLISTLCALNKVNDGMLRIAHAKDFALVVVQCSIFVICKTFKPYVVRC